MKNKTTREYMAKTKRKQMVMLEHIGDTNSWTYYAVFDKSVTPKQAIRWYEKQMELKKSDIVQEFDAHYSKNENVRAYYFTVSTLN